MTTTIILSLMAGVTCLGVTFYFQILKNEYFIATFFLLLAVWNFLVVDLEKMEINIMEKLDAIHEVSAP